MWYWYLLGVAGLSIGLFSYSSLVVAGRADERRGAFEREERPRSGSCDSTPGTEPSFNDNSEERVSLSTSPLPPKTPLTNIKHPSP